MFDIFTCSPLHMAHTHLAKASLKAQGVALFDLSYCQPDCLPHAEEQLQRFISETASESRMGLKVPLEELERFEPLLQVVQQAGRKCILVLCDLPAKGFVFPEALNTSYWECWAEVRHTNQEELTYHKAFSAILVKGNENGGGVGEENTYVLAQKYLKHASQAVYVQGSMGFHTAAACIAAGAKGIVLDDQLLAFKEAATHPYRQVIEKIEAGNTQVLEGAASRQRVVQHPSFSADAPIGWGAPEKYRWPIGQGIAWAAQWARTYKTVGRLFKAIRASVQEHIVSATSLQHLAENAPLAAAHGTRFPIVQGPMTRVSDKSAFAKSVAEAGALPFLALSMLSGKTMTTLLEETKEVLEGQAWGVGILGFVPEALRQEQLKAIKTVRPGFALIAGGTVDQVHDLEASGIQTYLHAPTASLLKIFLDKGCKRFVFEGRECGGHVGPLGSFTLWESVIELLLEVPDEKARDLHLLFAGGIHDAQSAMMVAAMTGRLAAKGIKIGLLMGTAYLFTHEVCDSGAVLPTFQEAAINCQGTSVIETGPGHAIRCVPTPFVDEFNTHKARAQGATPAQQLSEELEQMTLGRLRMASKGMLRNPAGELVSIDAEEQFQKGMYMVGQVASMQQNVQKMEALHMDVSVKGTELLKEIELAQDQKEPSRNPVSIAIVGMSTILPKASEVAEFWDLVLNYQKALEEVPEERWDWKLYYDENQKAKDKIVSKWGGFIDDVLFDPLKYGIPPHSLKSISPAQLLLLEAVERALQHAGYGEGGYDKERTSIIVGSDGTSALKNQYATRTLLPQHVDSLSEEDFERLPEWNEESFAGVLTNVLAGRVANRFNLGGANFAVDAACASSLTAIDLAVKELEQGNSKMVIAAGVDIAQSQYSYTAFSKTQALSPTGSSNPFDSEANGIVISEGTAVVLLKQLEDAERDGDTIYAVIKGSACSSDGKGLGLTAPRSSGQERAFSRAYEQAGFSPATLGFYEAHATGTSVGDQVELQSIVNILKQAGASANACSLGAVKGLIGHTKTSAGVVGLVKAALSLYHKTLSPHRTPNQPLSLLKDSESPVCLRNDASPWFSKNESPRRAGVSAFGFGGTNTHVVLEEYRDHVSAPPSGQTQRPAELFLFAEASKEALLSKLEHWFSRLSTETKPELADLAFVAAKESEKFQGGPRLGIVARNLKELCELLQRSIQKRSTDQDASLPPQVALNLSVKKSGKMAFLFPGQGAQHLQMARENALYLPQIRKAVQDAEEALDLEKALSQLVYPETAFTDEVLEQQQKALTQTQHAQPAIGVVSKGYLEFLEDLGLKPHAVAGHSYGEFTALHAAGVLSEKDFLAISQTRGALMQQGCEVDGTMAVVKADAETVQAFLSSDEVSIANLNAPQQTVISGERRALKAVLEQLQTAGIKAQEIDVAGPFHTRFFQSAQQPLEEAIQALQLEKAQSVVYSNTEAGKYPKGGKRIKKLLSKHLLSPVRFTEQIEQMYQDGVRLFVEVGPKQILTGLVQQILKGKEHQAVAVEGHGGGLKGLLTTLAQLYVQGYDLNVQPLFEGRVAYHATLQEVLRAAEPPVVSKASVWLNGAGIKSDQQGRIQTGNLPVILAENRKAVGVPPENHPQHSIHLNEAAMKFSEEGLLEGYQAYQKTMQQFLVTQERMAQQFFAVDGQHAVTEPMNTGKKWEKPEIKAIAPKQERAKTIQELSDSQRQESVKAASPSKTVSRENIGNKMMEIISDRTGYPLDMLSTDIDLEAELGIDSIKRIEILDKVLKELPSEHEAQLQEKMQPLMRTKTIDAFLDIAFDPSLQVEERQVETVPDASQESSNEACPRFVMQAVPSPLGTITTHALTGLYFITPDTGRVAERVKQELETKGAQTVLLPREVLVSPQKLNEHMLQLLEQHADVKGVVHCAALGQNAMPGDLDTWKQESQSQSKSLFQILRLLAIRNSKEGKAPVQQVVAASMFGGHFGRTARFGSSLPLAGSHCGLLKTLSKEWSGLQARAVDFDNQLLESEMARRLVQELQKEGDEVEVGYPEGERMLFQPIEAEFSEEHKEASQLPEDAVVLATGGAKGITSEVCKAMVAPGMTLILAGRSEQIDLELRPEGVTSASFASLKEQGVQVVYHSVDLRKEEDVKGLLEEVYETYGRLDALIHGAGVIEDCSIDQKGLSSFDKVFDTKVDTSFLLYKYLRPASLKLLVFFGSVSGRFGNQGQTDYAAANEVLNRFAWHLSSQWKDTRILTINWGPWSNIGMASDTVMRLLKAQGMDPIGPRMGCDFFLREIQWGQQETAEVIAGSGPWAQEKALVSSDPDFADIFNFTAIGSDGELTEQ